MAERGIDDTYSQFARQPVFGFDRFLTTVVGPHARGTFTGGLAVKKTENNSTFMKMSQTVDIVRRHLLRHVNQER